MAAYYCKASSAPAFMQNSRFLVPRSIEGDIYSKSNIFDSKLDEKRRLANTLYQEFVRAKERYSDYFELSNIVVQ